ncbi:MAG: DNA repair protein RecO [Firmicutes bacterium]|nr:DNA repair protein RecO [Bacillota bacterium]
MYTETEGIILKQINTVNGRRMLHLFSRKFGKISAGTGISERSRSKAGLAMRPFTYGRYELYKGRETYNINSAEAIRSYYRIGEDVDKYMHASYVLELVDKLTVEEHSFPQLFNLTLAFLSAMEERKKKYGTLVLAFELKALKLMGIEPRLDACVVCGAQIGSPAGKEDGGSPENPPAAETESTVLFSIPEGGIICGDCAKKTPHQDGGQLIYSLNTGIVDILRYFVNNPMKNIEKLGLDDGLFREIHTIVKAYMEHHLGIGKLKSEDFIGDS